MIHILRASYANEFELQNYAPLAKQFDIQVVTSHHPITTTTLPQKHLWSPTDLSNFPFRKQLFNRLIGGEQWLFGLDHIINHGDIIHTAETYTPYTHQAVQLRKREVIKKLICTCWETIPHNNEKFAKWRQWKREAHQHVDLFHTPTLRAKNALITEGIPAYKIKIIPYGVDTSHFHPLQGLTLKLRKPVILTVARAVPEKGYAIWQQLSRELAHLADFRWVTGIPYADMSRIYCSADIFFLPSQTTPTWEEQYGMVLVEAMASGLPIVATTSGAIPEVVGSAGILCDPQDVAGMKKALLSLLPPRCSNIGISRARKYYDHQKVAKQLLALYST